MRPLAINMLEDSSRNTQSPELRQALKASRGGRRFRDVPGAEPAARSQKGCAPAEVGISKPDGAADLSKPRRSRLKPQANASRNDVVVRRHRYMLDGSVHIADAPLQRTRLEDSHGSGSGRHHVDYAHSAFGGVRTSHPKEGACVNKSFTANFRRLHKLVDGLRQEGARGHPNSFCASHLRLYGLPVTENQRGAGARFSAGRSNETRNRRASNSQRHDRYRHGEHRHGRHAVKQPGLRRPRSEEIVCVLGGNEDLPNLEITASRSAQTRHVPVVRDGNVLWREMAANDFRRVRVVTTGNAA